MFADCLHWFAHFYLFLEKINNPLYSHLSQEYIYNYEDEDEDEDEDEPIRTLLSQQMATNTFRKFKFKSLPITTRINSDNISTLQKYLSSRHNFNLLCTYSLQGWPK